MIMRVCEEHGSDVVVVHYEHDCPFCVQTGEKDELADQLKSAERDAERWESEAHDLEDEVAHLRDELAEAKESAK